MERKHFLERLEHEIDYHREYLKLEAFCNEIRPGAGRYDSINEFIDQFFWQWEDRYTFSSFSELREHMGFATETKRGMKYYPLATEMDMNGYLSFCEMILTIISALEEKMDSSLLEVKNAMIKTMRAVVENAGFEFKRVGREVQVVEKNAVAIEVADKVPELADVIIEYNHYLLKGDIDKKKIILKQIADALEPKRITLKNLQNRNTEDFFQLVNEMNIRHNNVDPLGKRYNAKFSLLSPEEQEKWYDLLYEQALGLYVVLAQQERNKMIDTYKQEIKLEPAPSEN